MSYQLHLITVRIILLLLIFLDLIYLSTWNKLIKIGGVQFMDYNLIPIKYTVLYEISNCLIGKCRVAESKDPWLGLVNNQSSGQSPKLRMQQPTGV